MGYETTTVHEIYGACVNVYNATPLDKAKAWVEAENLHSTFAILIRWFEMMQRGEADLKYPDPHWKAPPGRLPLTQKLADQIIQEITEDFDIESARFPPSKLGPGFDRLVPHARLRLAQELMGELMSEEEIGEEAEKRMAKEEEFPAHSATF